MSVKTFHLSNKIKTVFSDTKQGVFLINSNTLSHDFYIKNDYIETLNAFNIQVTHKTTPILWRYYVPKASYKIPLFIKRLKLGNQSNAAIAIK